MYAYIPNLNVSEECFDEIMGLVEEVINEKVTVGDLAKATEKSIPNRVEALKKAISSNNYYNRKFRKTAEDDPNYDTAKAQKEKAASKLEREGMRALHARSLEKLNLPKDSKVSANKLFKANAKVENDRYSADDSWDDEPETREHKRASRSFDVAMAEPAHISKNKRSL